MKDYCGGEGFETTRLYLWGVEEGRSDRAGETIREGEG
jgi:hypothetical protein